MFFSLSSFYYYLVWSAWNWSVFHCSWEKSSQIKGQISVENSKCTDQRRSKVLRSHAAKVVFGGSFAFKSELVNKKWLFTLSFVLMALANWFITERHSKYWIHTKSITFNTIHCLPILTHPWYFSDSFLFFNLTVNWNVCPEIHIHTSKK